jgi:curli biogenesis system outer membrane secretion channel CsgG
MRGSQWMCGAVLVGAMLCQDAFAKDAKPKPEPPRAVVDADALPACDGPKPRLAVVGFNATGKLGAYEGFNVGDGLAAQLATELERSGCFVVLDRTATAGVLQEQELALAGIVNRETGPKIGQMVGAEFVLKGTVTEYEPNSRGRGGSIGFGLPKVPFGLRLGGNHNKAQLAMDLSIVDTSSGVTKFTNRVEASSDSKGFTVGFDFEDWSVGTDDFAKSPLGLAARNALGQAVTRLIAERPNLQLEWRMRVAAADGGLVVLNEGAKAGIKVGDTYRVSTPVRTLTDPQSGLVLDREERDVGSVKIVSVEDNYSRAEPLAPFDIKRGDFVHL